MMQKCCCRSLRRVVVVVADVLLRLEGLAGGMVTTSLGIPLTDLSAIGASLDHLAHDQESCLLSQAGSATYNGPNGDSCSSGITTCPICGKRVQMTYLALHLKRTHDSLEARCPLCEKKFKNKHSLGVHQARYHPRQGGLLHQQSPQMASMHSNLHNNIGLVNTDLLRHQQQLQNVYNLPVTNSIPGTIFSNVVSMQGQQNSSAISSSPSRSLNSTWMQSSLLMNNNSEFNVPPSHSVDDLKDANYQDSLEPSLT